MTGAVRQALEAGFKSGPGLKAHQHLGADDEQAALIATRREIATDDDSAHGRSPGDARRGALLNRRLLWPRGLASVALGDQCDPRQIA